MQSKVGLSRLSSRGNSGAWCRFSESGRIRERLKMDDGEKGKWNMKRMESALRLSEWRATTAIQRIFRISKNINNPRKTPA